MANFKDIKGGDPEGLQNHNKKKPEAKPKLNPIENMIQGKLDELFYEEQYIHNPIKEIYILSENIHDLARAIQEVISELEEALSNNNKDAK